MLKGLRATVLAGATITNWLGGAALTVMAAVTVSEGVGHWFGALAVEASAPAIPEALLFLPRTERGRSPFR